MKKETTSKPQRLAVILGLTAGVLAWGAALVSYVKTGEIRLGLIAAGLFFAALPFGMKSGTKKQK